MMRLGLGTAALGRPQYINIKQSKSDDKDLEAFKLKGIQVLETAYRLGVRYFDTAPGYGMAEQLIFDWLRTKNDDRIEIATKWGYTYTANFNPNAELHEVKEHSLGKLNEQWQFSKGMLPNLKLYQIHSATLETGVLKNESVLNRLHQLKSEHQLKMGVTVSGDNQVEIIKEALKVSVNNQPLFDAFQVTYNPLEQSLTQVYDDLKRENKKIIIKEAMANGRIFRNKNYAHYAKMYGYLEHLAEAYNVGVDAIVLNFCLQTIPESTVLSGASNSTQLKANLKAQEFNLQSEEINHLKTFQIEPPEYWNERKQLSWQ